MATSSPAQATSERTAPAQDRREGRGLLFARAVAAPAILAATTVAAVAGAVLALLPAVVRGRPAGRAAGRGGAGELPGSDTASEPLAP